MSCEQCVKESRVYKRLTRLLLQNPNEYITGPDGVMQIDLVTELLPSGGYQNLRGAMDVFSRYLIAYLTTNQDAKIVARVTINKMTKHAYLPRTKLSDMRSVFVSRVIKEVADVLGITPEHVTTKHAETIGLFERTHVWFKKTSYHRSIACEPSRVFHGSVPYKVLDLKMGILLWKQPMPNLQAAQNVLEQTE